MLIAARVTPDSLNQGLRDVYDLATLADYLGMADVKFWDIVHMAHRILLDAAAFKKDWEC